LTGELVVGDWFLVSGFVSGNFLYPYTPSHLYTSQKLCAFGFKLLV